MMSTEELESWYDQQKQIELTNYLNKLKEVKGNKDKELAEAAETRFKERMNQLRSKFEKDYEKSRTKEEKRNKRAKRINSMKEVISNKLEEAKAIFHKN